MEPQVVIPVASSAASAATAAASPRSDNRPLDYSSLLLSLAEEYVAAAHQLGSAVGLRAEQREANRYSRLIAMGLGCIDAVLKNFRLHPRTEATLRFRYASLLYEETENDDEAEDVLSKAITLCERNRLSDLKYSMYHLRSRIMFKSSPKAAFRALDHLIPDAEAYKHYTWVYSLRFLRASLSVQTGSHAETGHALNHLRQIMSLAETRGDTAIYVTAATLESVIHLRNGSPDAVEQSQRAIAAARSYQLQTEEDEYPQVTALLYLVDLACSLIKFTPEEASTKMKMVQQLADKCKESRSWKADGSFVILVEQAMGNQEAVNVTGGIIDKAPDGRDMLNFAWLNRRDLYVLTYLFSSVVALMKQDGKADMFIHEGLKAINESGSFDPANAPKEESLTHASSRIKWVTYVRWQMRLCRAFALCNRAEWKSAKACLKSLSSDLSSTSLEVPAIIPQLCTYLEGVIFQGAGDLSAALSTYESLTSQLPASQSARSAFSAAADVATLAAFNACLILLDPEHPQHERFGELAERLERLCPEHPNPTIQSAYHLIRAAAGRNNEPMTKKKVWLQQALHKAKQAGNSQILAVSMAFMAAEFFTNILGEQAEKSAKAAKTLASRCKSGLWGVVAGAMFAETLEKHGKGREAAQMRAEVEANLGGLPEGLREKCSQG
ncbi:cohesin loading factor [Lineolata rhizophorae]|uniref:Cohesin loading factor n=1 Tax=Lineolata rhizophorae TaxID=578093 RepID=A0A6A6NS79_9PEZI|nr:cohesin loading factor [Lineolata rhizophorae]